MPDVALGDIAVLAAAIVVGGVVTGLLAGVFGVGGGAVIVPVLYEIFRVLDVPEDVRMQLCVGTSLAIIAPTSLRSFLAHRARGDLPMQVIRIWALPVAAGISTGAAIAGFAPAWVFKLAFVVVTSLVAVRMFMGGESFRLGDRLPGWPLMAVYGFFIGLYSAFMGVGGGSVTAMVLVLYGTAIHVAVGLSAGIGVIIATTGTLGFMLAGLPQQALTPPLSIGFVSLIGFLLMAPITTAVAPLGARFAHRLSRRTLEIVFGVFLVAVALRFTVSLL